MVVGRLPASSISIFLFANYRGDGEPTPPRRVYAWSMTDSPTPFLQLHPESQDFTLRIN
jgi:hypothetical protein